MNKPIKSRFKTEAKYKQALKKYNDFVKSNKTQTKSKTTTKQPAKRKPFDPPKRGRGRPRKQQPTQQPTAKTNQTLKIKEGAKTVAKTTKEGVKTVVKKAGEAKQAVGKKVNQVKKFVSKESPVKKPTTTGQKLVSGANQGIKKTARGVARNIKAAGLKIGRGLARDPKSLLKGAKGAGLSYVAEQGTKALINRAFKPKGMSASEYAKKLEEMKGKRNIVKSVKKVVNKFRGRKTDTNSNTNTKKTTPSSGLKSKRTQYSSKNARKKQDFGAATGTKKADKRFGTFREDPTANRKLQLERQDGKKETYSRRLSSEAKKQTSETKANKDKKKKQSGMIKTRKGLARRGSLSARRAENREAARKRAQEMARRRLANR